MFLRDHIYGSFQLELLPPSLEVHSSFICCKGHTICEIIMVDLKLSSLVEIAREVVSLLAPAILSAGKMIALDIEDETVIVRGRKEAIATALRNLIENAVRVTPAGGMIQVFVGPGATTGVRDEGPGLDQERLRDLVRRHRRADHASKDGAGLGLAIVDQIMAAHDGLLVSDPDRRELMLRFPDV